MARPKGTKTTKAVPITATPRLIAYLEQLVALEGYGTSKAEVARSFVWKEINRLLEVGVLNREA